MGKVQPWPVLRWPPSVSSNFVWRFLCSALHHLFLGSFLGRLARKADSTPRVKYACKTPPHHSELLRAIPRRSPERDLATSAYFRGADPCYKLLYCEGCTSSSSSENHYDNWIMDRARSCSSRRHAAGSFCRSHEICVRLEV